MRKLDPAQARWLKQRAEQRATEVTYPGEWEWIDRLCRGYEEAIDELTAKAGEEEYCKGCSDWGYQIPRCYNIDFDGKHCPRGRWEEK